VGDHVEGRHVSLVLWRIGFSWSDFLYSKLCDSKHGMIGLRVGEHDGLVTEPGPLQAVHLHQLGQRGERLKEVSSGEGEHRVGHSDQPGGDLQAGFSLLTRVARSGADCP